MKINVKKALGYTEEILAAVFLVATTILFLINVFTRYFLRTGIFWCEEVTTGCFVWCVFLGAAAAYKRKMHVSVDLLINRIKGHGRRIVQILLDIILLCINAYITWMAINYVKISYPKPTPVLGISSVSISASVLISFALMTIYSIRFIVMDLKKSPEEKGAEKK